MQLPTIELFRACFPVTTAILMLLGQTLAIGAEQRPGELNGPPEGFTAIFNGEDFTGWHIHPKVKEMWSIEDGVLRSPGLIETFDAGLMTKKKYRDFILMVDFRMPAISDSGILFRDLIPYYHPLRGGSKPQFNLRSTAGFGHLESFQFMSQELRAKHNFDKSRDPKIRHIEPEVGVWHTVKITLTGRTFSAEYDGELLYDRFEYPEWLLSTEPSPILLQKHAVVRGQGLGAENPCPIEFRNVFIKELDPDDVVSAASPSAGEGHRKLPKSPNAELLGRIDAGELPKEYDPARHQNYVDRRMAKLSEQQRGMVGRLWKEKETIDPDMPNRGSSFVKILAYVAKGETLPAKNGRRPDPSTDDPVKSRGGNSPESRTSQPVHAWKWSAATDAEGGNRKAIPLQIPEGPTIHVVPFGLLDADNPPVVLLPGSRLAVTGRLATAHPVYFGITMNHPNGDFAGRFVTMRPADECQSGEDLKLTLDLQNFQLDSSLAQMKDKLPSEPFHFVVESIWFTTLEQQAKLEIVELELIPPTEGELQ